VGDPAANSARSRRAPSTIAAIQKWKEWDLYFASKKRQRYASCLITMKL
jgi:hypothetical protein